MPDFSFVVVAVIAFTAPVLRELIPRLFVPSIVLELLLGIIVGPQVLGIAHASQPVDLFSTIGLAACCSLPVARSTSSEFGERCWSAASPASRSAF